MRKLLHFIKAAYIFATHQAWPDNATWTESDAKLFTAFLESGPGARLRRYLTATVVLQQSEALNRKDNLVYEAGFCAGQKALVAVISTLADKTRFTEQGDSEADPATN